MYAVEVGTVCPVQSHDSTKMKLIRSPHPHMCAESWTCVICVNLGRECLGVWGREGRELGNGGGGLLQACDFEGAQPGPSDRQGRGVVMMMR